MEPVDDSPLKLWFRSFFQTRPHWRITGLPHVLGRAGGGTKESPPRRQSRPPFLFPISPGPYDDHGDHGDHDTQQHNEAVVIVHREFMVTARPGRRHPPVRCSGQ
jgi:hypothetical protein